MRILIEIGHPAHVHYFRNFYSLMKKKNHELLFTARDKEVAIDLLDYYKLPYKKRGKGKKGLFGKLFYTLVADYFVFKYALTFKPDIFLSFANPYAGHVAFLLRKPHILMDDTEHASLSHRMYKPFASVIFTPTCFYKIMGVKQLYFKSYMELTYLHKAYFSPNKEVYNDLGITPDSKYIIIRFVAWGASHDIGQEYMNENKKIELVKSLAEKMNVFITSETGVPKELEKYKIKIPPHRLHDALAFSTMYIGEGATTASEAAILGVPTIYINSLPLMGYLKEQQKAGILFHFSNEKGALEKAMEVLRNNNGMEYKENSRKLISKKIDLTSLLVWFTENYPGSISVLKNDNTFQDKFL